ncbi:hypothetical protein NEMBOFW57_006939 [Staphylotrichum longicolle]|uniref:Uncharacterized protein n=1 Tax=Staphylotrichum longicolle TaxID=669026 RepID=A0AAD4ETQ7_9PEZI|nr:hypothetical protein NEMBOFW57_006939 [Staphylotrichum longicolle]
MASGTPESPMRPRPGIERYRADEVVFYEELVAEGGRPVYDISLLNTVSANPSSYRALTSLWKREEGDWRVFGTQLRRWKEFRMWQRDNRGIVEMDAEFDAHVETRKRRWRHYGLKDEAILGRLASSINREDWDARRIRRLEEVKELQFGDFPQYVTAVKKRLAAHDFTKRFNLKEDPRSQDALATWIEYLDFEWWWTDKYEDWNQRNVEPHDEAWEKLEDACLLQPGETEEDIWSISKGMQRMMALESARQLARDTKAYLEHTMRDEPSPEPPGTTPSRRAKLVQAAQTKHNEAQNSLMFLEARRKAIDKFQEAFREYWDTKQTTDHLKARAHWIQEQVELVEAETKRAPSAKARGRKKAVQKTATPKLKKRKSENTDDPVPEHASSPQPKRVRQVKEENVPHLRRSARVRGIPPPSAPAPAITGAVEKKKNGGRGVKAARKEEDGVELAKGAKTTGRRGRGNK